MDSKFKIILPSGAPQEVRDTFKKFEDIDIVYSNLICNKEKDPWLNIVDFYKSLGNLK